MSGDAVFEDGDERPLRLRAERVEDLDVISALLQDAVTRVGETAWMSRRRRFTLLFKRFRWEDSADARTEGRKFERVQSLLSIASAMKAGSESIDPTDRDAILSLLSIRFEADDDCAGKLVLTFAGDGEIVLEVECLDVSLTDVTRPYEALSNRVPSHLAE